MFHYLRVLLVPLFTFLCFVLCFPISQVFFWELYLSCFVFVDFTCLNCFSQTHFTTAVGHELVDPKRRTRFFNGEGGFHVNSS